MSKRKSALSTSLKKGTSQEKARPIGLKGASNKALDS